MTERFRFEVEEEPTAHVYVEEEPAVKVIEEPSGEVAVVEVEGEDGESLAIEMEPEVEVVIEDTSLEVAIEMPPEVAAVEVEVPGPAGPQGEPGELVTGTGDLHYHHIQGQPTDDVTIFHGLGKRPSIRVIDSSGRDVVGDYEHVNDNMERLRFSAPFSFEAFFN